MHWFLILSLVISGAIAGFGRTALAAWPATAVAACLIAAVIGAIITLILWWREFKPWWFEDVKNYFFSFSLLFYGGWAAHLAMGIWMRRADGFEIFAPALYAAAAFGVLMIGFVGALAVLLASAFKHDAWPAWRPRRRKSI